jgi:hypothetical protein
MSSRNPTAPNASQSAGVIVAKTSSATVTANGRSRICGL